MSTLLFNVDATENLNCITNNVHVEYLKNLYLL